MHPADDNRQETADTADRSANCDGDLVQRAANGDHRAFTQLAQRYYERALRVSYGLLKSQHDAEDVVQEAFVKVYRRLNEFRAASGFYTWLYRIVVNLSIDRLRRQRRERQVQVEDDDCREAITKGRELWPTFPDSDPEMHVQRQQLGQQLQHAFESLPEIHRAVLVLREVDGLSYEAIAQTLGIKTGTVMSRLFHARRSMQRQLGTIQQPEQQEGGWFDLAPLAQMRSLALN